MADTIPTLFFLNGVLHKRIKVSKMDNAIVAWNYIEEEVCRYTLSYVSKDYQRAFDISKTAELLKRPVHELRTFMRNKVIDRPSGFEYHINSRRPKKLLWSEDDVLELRDQLHEFAPKDKYGLVIKSFKLATRAELLASFRNEDAFFVQGEDGKMIRVWKAV